LAAIAISTGQSGLDHSATGQGQIMSSVAVVDFPSPAAGIQKPKSSTLLRQQSPSPAALVLTLVLTTFVRIGQAVCLSQRTPHPTLLMILDEGELCEKSNVNA